jgi:hypothetical protein
MNLVPYRLSFLIVSLLASGITRSMEDLTVRANKKLLEAAQTGDLAQAQDALRRGADKNAQTLAGHTALYEAVWHGHAEIVAELLQAAADPNARGWVLVGTPLRALISCPIKPGHAQIVALLLEHQAVLDPDHQPEPYNKIALLDALVALALERRNCAAAQLFLEAKVHYYSSEMAQQDQEAHVRPECRKILHVEDPARTMYASGNLDQLTYTLIRSPSLPS